ncbi:MAG: glycosyltransferase family 2 protein [Chloroflexi bacterium]|nr:glycosyltransferase family 2 protein [Chloroflexota bacterium]
MTIPVSIIVPCRNEEKTIRHLLESIISQTYPMEKLELILSDAQSTDKTLEVVRQFQREHAGLHLILVENTRNSIPAGLNQAIRQASGEILIRLDAHSIPIPEYVQRCVEAHQKKKGDNIGGVWDIRAGAGTWIAEGIAEAAAHPLGAGDAMYRLNAIEGAVDTVPFGSFKRSLIDRVGYFDESLLTNEDYEFNVRVREAGGLVWLDPTIRSVYFARGTFGELAKQYWRYGYWKFRMLRRYPHTLRWRQALPPVFVATMLGLSVLSLWFVPAVHLLGVQILVYFLVLAGAGIVSAIKRNKIPLSLGMPIAMMIMHFSWGIGFLWSMTQSMVRDHG